MTYSKKITEQQHEKTVLANGLTILTMKKVDVSSVTIEVLVKAGSRNEEENANGIAHFIEHMNFKGTKSRTAEQIAEEFDAIGGYLNAYTTKENTAYTAKVLKEFFPIAVEVISDIMFNSVYREEDISKEKSVVLQELAQTEDVPEEMIFEYFSKAVFDDAPLGKTILGTAERIKNFSKEDITNFIDQNYQPENIIISIVGNYESYDVIELIEKYFGFIKQTRTKSFKQSCYVGGHHYESNRQLSQLHLVLGYEGLPVGSEDYYKKEMLANILGGSISSRLFQEIREKRGLVYNVSSFCQYFVDTGVFGISLSCSEDKLNETLDVLSTQIENITKNINQIEVDRCLAQVKAALYMGRETSESWVSILAANYAYFGRYIPCDEIWSKYQNVSVDDILSFAQKIFSKNKKISIAALGSIDVLPSYEELQKRLTI